MKNKRKVAVLSNSPVKSETPESKESFKKYLESTEVKAEPIVKGEKWSWVRQLNSKGEKIVTLTFGGFPYFDSLNDFTDKRLNGFCALLNRAPLGEETKEKKS